MKKIIIPIALIALVALVLPLIAMMAFAENETAVADSEMSIPEDTPVTYGYLLTIKEQLRQEIIEELAAEGGITIATTYEDISVKEGEIILLSPDTEVIYRGGGAVAITSTDNENDGLTDMSGGTEIFSGQALEYGHIYHSSSGESKKAILVTGSSAYFTVRGDYEIIK